MNCATSSRRLFRMMRKMVVIPVAWLRMAALATLNRLASAPVTQRDGPVVSLTSYGKRILKVHFAIESIARGETLPSRIILWLDDASAFADLPAPLRRLQARGLEIRLTANYGPHTKYYPYIASEDRFERALVTADDDQLYPRWWLSRLTQAYAADPNSVYCHRARVVGLERAKLASYRRWELCRCTAPSYRHIALGVSGVIYPPAFLAVLKQAGAGFRHCCPSADDLWLHVQAVRAGFPARQISKRAQEFPTIPNTQRMALYRTNVKHGNDMHAAATYTAADLVLLQAQAGVS